MSWNGIIQEHPHGSWDSKFEGGIDKQCNAGLLELHVAYVYILGD